ncbi:hypothetical protein BD324DRAFT_651753 [Kockovaella imperatae]|uniref:P-loop containing nucleoside triphosphate hydrolase protein n=1 Tax=Kockovaella imperatae TaxID=4999 RepID=A0A1Y1UHF4_9TREE|nr:hypothetical protein BD324DRAFT_651753 [Kockovaella imperatae]ORX36515.1 hypothetical protein BD324DRAFT_651753 [Kockovaella imperatae]
MSYQAQSVFDASNIAALANHRLKSKPGPFLLKHSLFLLPILVIASLALLLLTLILPSIYRFFKRHVFRKSYQPIRLEDDDEDGDAEAPAPEQPMYMPSRGFMSDFKAHVRSLQEYGSILFVMEVIRVLALGALLGLSIVVAIRAESPSEAHAQSAGDVEDWSKWGKKKHKNKHKHHHKTQPNWDDYTHTEWEEFGICGFYAYCLIFAFLLLTLRPATSFRRHIIAHLDMLLLLAFSLYAYRDLYPLATYNLMPRDVSDVFTWTRVGLLGLVSVVIPIIRPRTYVPADPAFPTPKGQIAPEQTAPWLFLVFYEFMTGLVLRAWRVPSLPYEGMHPLADYDKASFLYKLHMPNLDPIRRRVAGLKSKHLVFTLVWNLRWDAFVTCLMCAITAATELSGSVGTNMLLKYLETDGKGATVRPWVWAALLFIGPVISSLTIQWYIFVMTRALIRCESIISMLIFEHALRLRMRESTEKEEKEEPKPINPALIDITVEDIENAPGKPLLPSAPEPTVVESENGTDDTEVGSSSQASNKGKIADKKAESQDGSEEGTGQGIAGKINVLIAADVSAVVEGRDFPLIFVLLPVQLVLCVVFLYNILSWSSVIGMLFMAVTLPVPGLITKWTADIQNKRMAATDVRVDTITEVVGALRMVKMFGWEDRIKERVASKREHELDWIYKRRLASLANMIIYQVLPVLTMAITFACYTIVQKRELTAATVFTSMTVFDLIKNLLGMTMYMVSQFITSGVSLNRIDKFLRTSDLTDEFTEGYTNTCNSPEYLEAKQKGLIRIKDAIFSWGVEKTTTNANFSIRIPDITFAKGKINLITGPTGSGKSSLLKALIGELHFIGGKDSFYHLPREGGVSYAAQESWLLSETLKENILFGEEFNAERYNKVIKACALETDLKLLDDGEDTEIGEKGVTLSGGQKARVTLARAVYSPSAVVLLDDIFSALDTLTSRFILEHLFKGDLMKDRTVLLITHHVHFAAPIADYMVSLDESGRVKKAGPIDQTPDITPPDSPELMAQQNTLQVKEIDTEGDSKAKAEDKTKHKLIQDEEKSEGRISKKAMFSFFSNFGGPVFWLTFWFLLIGGQAVVAYQSYWLGRWARAYQQAADWHDVSIKYYLGFYMIWVAVAIFMTTFSTALYYLGAIKASRVLHRRLVDSIFAAYVRFLDTTPVGRIISRFTKDMRSIDGSFPETAEGVFEISVSLIIKFVIVVSLVPLFSIPAIVIGAIGGFMGEMYIHSQLSIKREMSNAKSPLFSHFSAAVNGIVSIRAYGAQDKLRREAQRRADKYTRAGRNFYNLNRWITIRVDMLGALFGALLGAFLVYGPRMDASTSGFALSQAISFSSMILWWIRMVNEMEVEGNSVERIEDYLKIEQEPASETKKQPPASWPTSGEIVLENLSASYSKGGPIVLDNLNIRIASGEKVGIVGRTGSGKSTLSLAMLRLIPTTGSVIIDGRKTENVNLNALRSNVTIIPQDPILLSGTLRFNLDPFDEHEDAVLNDALQASGLGSVSRSSSGSATPQRLTLDFQVAAAGGNLSQGQRQLVALARALVRSSKVLILDEATASVDFETDALIQKSIRNLPSSTTVLTVAHRLSTVMDYDKILVLGAGKVLEFDSPGNLKQKKGSYFAKLVKAMDG